MYSWIFYVLCFIWLFALGSLKCNVLQWQWWLAGVCVWGSYIIGVLNGK